MKKAKTVASKIMTWRPSTNLIAVMSVLVLILLLIPILRLVFYAVPYYDDYNYGGFAKRGMEEIPGIVGALKGALNCSKIQWHAWQGTYSSIFFMALMPAIWGEDKYFLGPLFLVILLTVSVLVLVKVLVRDVIKADRASCVILQMVTAAAVVVFIHTANGGLFWYNAGIHYVGMHSIALLLIASQIRLLQTNRKSTTVVFMLLGVLGAFLVAGSNFVTALQGILVLLSIVALGVFFYKKRAWWLLPAIAVYIIGFFVNVLAPGNDVRAAYYVGWGYSPIQSVLQSFVEAFRHLGEFTGWGMAALLVLLTPVIWQMVKKCDFTFRLPGFVLVWSFCLYATGFTPSLFSLGNPGLSRALNAVKITYQLLLILNFVYWEGYLQKLLIRKQKTKFAQRPFAAPAPWWFYPCVAVMLLAGFAACTNQAGHYSSYGSYYYVHTGEAYNFYQQYQERVEILKSSESNVVFEPYRFKPWFLCTKDLSDNPSDESNRAVAAWYGKESVIVKKAE